MYLIELSNNLMMKTLLIIQARMTSSRLPGKVLMTIKNKPLLGYVLDRCKWSKSVDQIVIATSTRPDDTQIEHYAKSQEVSCYRGDLQNVLSRYYHCSQEFNADVVIRVTADCPLIDGHLIDEGLKLFFSNNFDYVSNTIHRTFPRGMDFEIISTHALQIAFHNSSTTSEHEHVTPYIWKSDPTKFRIGQIMQSVDNSNFRLTVDTQDDLELVKELIEKYQANKKTHSEITTLLETHPELVAINKHVAQKKV